jgi:acetyltransferase EpsM
VIPLLTLLGFGGHAKVLIDIAQLNGLSINSLYDDDIRKQNKIYNSIAIKAPIDYDSPDNIIIAIGDNRIRKNISIKATKAHWTSIIHPSAIISKDVYIGEGTVIMAGVIIQPGSTIGRHCIINTGACIDHDCFIEDFVHIAPKAALAGGVMIGEGTLIGIGSSIVPNVTIGKWSTIGAGAAVICDIPDNCIAVGVPAYVKKIENEST